MRSIYDIMNNLTERERYLHSLMMKLHYEAPSDPTPLDNIESIVEFYLSLIVDSDATEYYISILENGEFTELEDLSDFMDANSEYVDDDDPDEDE